ncbi:hypothetical protein [Psychrobacter sp. WY6]|uniref:hypothetical protein n=1 Tax=Psychrobacter sp. WY6 TaxID=2708350 RepID=UPI002022E545|nr:hypothetical protein [Psychrobacter sp. WY6]
MSANYARAPDVSAACTAAFGPLDKAMDESCVLSFRDLQGALGAAGWREKGVPIDSLGLSIFPHYGVFAPTRHEYVQLLLDAPLPAIHDVAYDIGTGTEIAGYYLSAARRSAGDSNGFESTCFGLCQRELYTVRITCRTTATSGFVPD